MTKKVDLPLVLLAIAGFLAPLLGGQVSVDALSLGHDSNPWLSALMGAPETALLSHAFLAVLCAGALATMLIQRKIMQVPNNTVSALVMILLGLILATVGVSNYRGVSIPTAIEWASYGIAFYAVVASTGRQRGPVVLIGAIFAGCVVLSLLGIRQYGDMKALDPTWRVFAQWNNPNAMASMLMIGLFMGLGLAVNSQRSTAVGIGIGCVAIGLCLFLTQSKGALLALGCGLFVLAVLLFLWLPRKAFLRALGTGVATLAVVGLLGAVITLQAKVGASHGGGGSSVADRLMNSGGSAEQSVGFRKLLWESTIQLIKANPFGTGIGTFQFESARPGLTTQTHFAHEAYLQLAAEASVLAPLLLVGALLVWVYLLLLGGAKLQGPQNVLRGCVLAAVCAIAVHGLVDSDFSYYGVGLVVFMLLGVGLLLSSDAVAPEFLPNILRNIAAVGVAALACFLLFFGYVEASRAQARGYLSPATINEAQSRLESLRSLAPWDADVWYMSALVPQEASKRLQCAKQAVELGPTARDYRLIARLENEQGNYADALAALRSATLIDPNNLQTLKAYADISAMMGDESKRAEALDKIIKVEDTPYFQVRSLPELIETTTYWARIQRSEKSPDPKVQISDLKVAVNGFAQYLKSTVPNVVKFAHNSDGPLPYGGETLDTAKQKMAEAALAAQSLADAYRKVGDTAGASAADAAAAEFAKPLDLPSSK